MEQIYTYPYEVVRNWTPDELNQKRERAKDWNVKPVLNSLVIPSFDKGKKYRKSLKNTLEKTAVLADSGAVNEVLIMDGSGSRDKPNRDFNRFILECAAEFSQDFRNQLDFVKKSANCKSLAKRGEFAFRYKVFNQKNPEYCRIFIEDIGPKLKTSSSEITERDIQQGKGNALKFSVPATKGDVICYNDSDIKTYEPFYATGLLMPFFKDNRISFTKATYIRRNTHGELGGRIKRLVYSPWANALAKGRKFNGLETLEYGTSGEFAIKRSLANRIVFDSGYKIETSLNTQVYHELHGNMNKIAQANLGIFEHFSSDVEENRKTGRDKAMQNMSREITEAWVDKAMETGVELDEDGFFEMYIKQVEPSVEQTEKMVANSEIARKAGIKYGKEQIELDYKRMECYMPYIKEGISNAIRNHYDKKDGAIPSWRSVIESCGINDYEDFKDHL